MKILTVIGARPQFIKAAVTSRALETHFPNASEIIVHTGQHYDNNMSNVFFEELNIPHPKFNLNVGGGSHAQNTGRMLEKIESLILSEKPDWVLVYGDTDSTLAGALAAGKLHIPVAHIEAGLRSFNRRMPEEINRVLTDHLSTLLFAPSEIARNNLLKEGVADKKIHVIGDVMYDAALFYGPLAIEPSWFKELPVRAGEYVLCTVHRAENTDDPDRMRSIFQGLAGSEVPIVLPLHPRTKAKLTELNISLAKNILIAPPVGYLEMVWLERNCRLIATDSGGVQKEAYFHKKRCVTLRDETEWVELVDGGFNVLVGADEKKIANEIQAFSPVDFNEEIYGSGDSAIKILKRILA